MLSRREALSMFGVAGVALVAAACSDGGSNDNAEGTATANSAKTKAASTTTTSPANATTTGAATTVDCVLTPEMTEGPYYLDDQVIRRDVTEGKTGIPLQLDLTVADASSCTPIPGLMVEIWHADAEGAYSGFGAGGSTTTFLRGGQNADTNGKVQFNTIYPGWYQGRTVHIHVKVHDGNTVHTTQLFFDQTLTNEVFTRSPYQGHSGGTTNSQDNIFSGGGTSTTLKTSESGNGYLGTLVMGVQR
ncbi:MAG: intradiol ring-cleavage dioxygenase [Acidimicrobiia bacterium]